MWQWDLLPAFDDKKESRGPDVYDQGDFSDTSLEQNIANVIMHDTANYGASFTVGRGNLTTSTRYDVTGATASVSSQIKYNIAGAPVAQITPWTTSSTRTTKIRYADAFNDTSETRNTYAYPTKLYDPAGNYSEVKYRFDTGANFSANPGGKPRVNHLNQCHVPGSGQYCAGNFKPLNRDLRFRI